MLACDFINDFNLLTNFYDFLAIVPQLLATFYYFPTTTWLLWVYAYFLFAIMCDFNAKFFDLTIFAWSIQKILR